MFRIVVISIVIAVPLLLLLVVLIGPEVDNVVNIVNGYNLRSVKDYNVGPQRLEEAISSKVATIFSWSSYHPDSNSGRTLYTSWVTCRARSAGGREINFSWEVGRFDYLKQDEGQKDFYLAPLTQAACCLTPALAGPTFACDQYPESPGEVANAGLYFPTFAGTPPPPLPLATKTALCGALGLK